MRCRYFHKAKLVTLFIHFFFLHQLVIGQEFKIAFDLAAIDPCKWIEPLKDENDLCKQQIKGMFLLNMDLLMKQYNLLNFYK